MPADLSSLVDEVSAQYGAAHRAVHAVGVGVKGFFTASAQASQLSSAAIFSGAPVAATVRFSNSVGFPVLPQMPPNDTNPDVRGMAVKFFLDDQPEGSMDMIAMTLDRFFDTVDVFQGFLRHIVPNPVTGVPDKEALEIWIHEHLGAASVLEAFGVIESLHDLSYAGGLYHGVHTFFYVNAAGVSTPGRFQWVPDTPEAPVATLPPGTLPDYLRRELAQRCRSGEGAGFTLQLTHPGVGDNLNLLSLPWKSIDPSDPTGKTVIPPTVMGHLEAGTLCTDQYWDCEALAFNPARLIDGVTVNPDDPIIAARLVAYGESHTRRTAIYPPPPR
jgi:catalase